MFKKYCYFTLLFCFFLWIVSSCNFDISSDNHLPCPNNTDHIDSLHDLSLNLCQFSELNKALSFAKTVNKPILAVYGGFAAVSNQKQVYKPLADPNANQLLKSEFIFLYLHVDDKTPLPDSLNLLDSRGHKLKTYGDFYMNREIIRYQKTTQPLYTIINYNDEDLINSPYTYKDFRDGLEFTAFLEKAMH